MYYAKVRGKVVGPLSKEVMMNMIYQGQVGKTSQISLDGQVWFPAERREELFPEPLQPTGNTSNSDYAPPASACSSVKEWYVSTDGRSGTGPYSQKDIYDIFLKKKISPSAIVWRDGSNPVSLSESPDFRFLFATDAGPVPAPRQPVYPASSDNSGRNSAPSFTPPFQQQTTQNQPSVPISLTNTVPSTSESQFQLASQLQLEGSVTFFIFIAISLFYSSLIVYLAGMVPLMCANKNTLGVGIFFGFCGIVVVALFLYFLFVHLRYFFKLVGNLSAPHKAGTVSMGNTRRGLWISWFITLGLVGLGILGTVIVFLFGLFALS